MTEPGAFQPTDEIIAEAALRLARLRADDRTLADERGFQAWLAADPAHVAAFEAMNATWNAAGSLSRDLRGTRRQEEKRRPVMRRREVLASAAALLAIGSVSTFWRRAEARIYQTDVGEQKHVNLDDGSRAFLDTDTRLAVSYSKEFRTTNLLNGRVNFSVAPLDQRPFVVAAAEQKVISNQSNFDVSCNGERVSVLLIRGQATVEYHDDGNWKRAAVLGGGQRLVMEAARTLSLDRPKMASLLAWQTGRAIFEDERLIDAVKEMNRYSEVKLRIGTPEIAEFRVNGAYLVGDNTAFANAIAQLLPVRVSRTNGLLVLVADDTHVPGR